MPSDSNLNLQVSDGCCHVGSIDGHEAVVSQEHEACERLFVGVGGFQS
jgi:hypothetical protein